MEKTVVTLDHIDAETAISLPERHMMALVNILVITGDIITIEVDDVRVGANVCAQVLARGNALACAVTN